MTLNRERARELGPSRVRPEEDITDDEDMSNYHRIRVRVIPALPSHQGDGNNFSYEPDFRARIRGKYDLESDSESSEEGEAFYIRPSSTMQLAQHALGRIRRAQMLGKHNIKLSNLEIEALEGLRRQDEAKST